MIFSAAHDVKTSASDINKDLKLISDWDFFCEKSVLTQIPVSRHKKYYLVEKK